MRRDRQQVKYLDQSKHDNKVTVRLTDEQLSELEGVARRMRLAPACVVRLALVRVFGTEES